jgi:ribosome recycling factor
MKKSVANLIGECDSRMNGYAVLLNYKYMNLCVKAEPASLLCVTVEYDNQKYDIEQVANVGPGKDEYHFEVFLKDQQMLVPVSKAIKTAHPEFKLDVKSVEDEGDSSDDSADEDEEKFILLTMPDVDDDRHDLLMNGVKSLFDECNAKLDINFQAYSTKIATQLAGRPAEELDEAKEALQKVNDTYAEFIKGFRAEKEKEIEEAYQRYLTEKTAEEQSRKEEEAAHGMDKGLSMQLLTGEDE